MPLPDPSKGAPSGQEWLVEEGIGEHRAIRLAENGQIAAARLYWPGSLTAGQVEDARLDQRIRNSPRGVAVFASGERAHIDRLPASASEGATMRLEVTRSRLAEAGRVKLAQCRPSYLPLAPAPTLAEQIGSCGDRAKIVRRFPAEAGWEELWSDASGNFVEFDGGSLVPYPTPAMLLIDIDGSQAPDRLAREAVAPLAAMLRRMDLGGNIGIDFPTVAEKARRKEIDELLERALSGWPHERTAINGFGFLQIVSRLERPSILHLLHSDPAGAHARRLLRSAEHLEGPGILALSGTRDVAEALQPSWIEQLERRTGRKVRVSADSQAWDPELCHVQVVSDD